MCRRIQFTRRRIMNNSFLPMTPENLIIISEKGQEKNNWWTVKISFTVWLGSTMTSNRLPFKVFTDNFMITTIRKKREDQIQRWRTQKGNPRFDSRLDATGIGREALFSTSLVRRFWDVHVRKRTESPTRGRFRLAKSWILEKISIIIMCDKNIQN